MCVDEEVTVFKQINGKLGRANTTTKNIKTSVGLKGQVCKSKGSHNITEFEYNVFSYV